MTIEPATTPSEHPLAPSVRVLDLGPNARAAVLAPPVEGGWLIVSQAYAPGWRALADGRSAPVVRAFGGLTAVVLPADAATQEVALRYRPASLVAGLVLAAAGLVLVVVTVAGGRATARAQPRPTSPPSPGPARSA